MDRGGREFTLLRLHIVAELGAKGADQSFDVFLARHPASPSDLKMRIVNDDMDESMMKKPNSTPRPSSSLSSLFLRLFMLEVEATAKGNGGGMDVCARAQMFVKCLV